jgi:hypothetical protein
MAENGEMQRRTLLSAAPGAGLASAEEAAQRSTRRGQRPAEEAVQQLSIQPVDASAMKR